MTDDAALPSPPAPAGPTSGRIALAVLASAARLVPVPVVDDLLRERVMQIAVRQILRAHGRTYSSRRLRPIWGEDWGCGGWLLRVLTLPLALLVYPIRKLWRWIHAARHLSADITTMILLGRALDRRLAAGHLADDGPHLEAEARRLWMAYENAARGMDTSLLRGAVGAAVASVGGLPRAAVRTLRSLWRRGSPEDAVSVEVPPGQRAAMDDGAARVRSALERPDVAEMLARFDARFDENLAILEARARG